MEAIVLAGGLGKRLRSAVSDLPKPMAPVNGKPFLTYLLYYLAAYRVDRCILATSYLHEKIEEHYGQQFLEMEIVYSVEEEPLGTGGGLRQAFSLCRTPQVLVLNGDTFFDVALDALARAHSASSADLTIALKPMSDIDRYGVVRVEDGRIARFEEKQRVASGLINGGVYLAKQSLFEAAELPEKFSFEEDFLKPNVGWLNVQAFISDSYFIDIGIPLDYKRAQHELKPRK